MCLGKRCSNLHTFWGNCCAGKHWGERTALLFPKQRSFAESEPFCTVCRREVSDPKAGSRKQFAAKPDGLSTFLRQGLPRSRGSGQPPIIQECNASQKSNAS